MFRGEWGCWGQPEPMEGVQIKATNALHDSVNGQSEAFKALIGKEAFGAGEKAGMEAERARPAEGKPA